MRELFNLWLWRGSAIVFLVLPLIFALVGPFGTYDEMTFLDRLIYWSVLVVGIGFLMVLTTIYMLSLPDRIIPHRPLRIVVGSALAAVPSAALVLFMHEVMRPQPEVTRGMEKVLLIYFQVFALGAAISLAEYRRMGYFALPVADPAAGPLFRPLPAEPPEDPALLDARADFAASRLHERLPPALQRVARLELISMSVQDHYVALTTTGGTTRVLMRFNDALAEAEGIAGARLHRSHWAAAPHMRGLSRDGNRLMLALSDGRELPVSKTYRPGVEALLDDR